MPAWAGTSSKDQPRAIPYPPGRLTLPAIVTKVAGTCVISGTYFSVPMSRSFHALLVQTVQYGAPRNLEEHPPQVRSLP